MMLITTLVVLFLACCRLEVRCGYAGVVSELQALACSPDTTNLEWFSCEVHFIVVRLG